MGIVDIIGFSHEYAFDCVRKIESIYDTRLLTPLLLVLSILWFFIMCKRADQRRSFVGQCRGDGKTGHKYILLFLTFLAWMATLFPVSGVIRVGTFIADRIVIASTVASSIFWTHILKIIISSGKAFSCNRDKSKSLLAIIFTLSSKLVILSS
jgi:hypothetical protein